MLKKKTFEVKKYIPYPNNFRIYIFFNYFLTVKKNFSKGKVLMKDYCYHLHQMKILQKLRMKKKLVQIKTFFFKLPSCCLRKKLHAIVIYF